MQEADYIIIGGGSAGCILANRLSADPRIRVLLIEAGGKGEGFWVDIPVGSVNLVGDERTDWIHKSEPDPSIGGRNIIWNSGKMLGGGGGLNGLVYIRGQRDDFDHWAELGCTGWSFSEVQPYFMRGERWEGDGDFQSHGRTGELAVTQQRMRSAAVPAFIEAAQGLGHKYIEDPAAGDIDGVFHTLTNQHAGRRCGPVQAYLAPARNRPNLEILTGTLVDRILFDGVRAVGVSARSAAGGAFQAHARREIILSSGAIQSPAILMRSGIGPASQLREHGIEIVADHQSVGRNMMDHPVIAHRRLSDLPSFNWQLRNRWLQAGEMLKYLMGRESLLSLSMGQALMGAKTLPELDEPDVLLFFSTWIFDSTKPPLRPGKAMVFPLHKKRAIGISSFICRPFSRGEIRLRSGNPGDSPIIQSDLLGDERDVETLVRAERLIESLFAAPALARHVTGRLTPELRNDEERRQYVRATASIGWHASGTCRMGGDPASVVDPRLRVRGIERLRVADASIMPVVTSGNTNAPTMMIGEKASSMILEDAAVS